MSKASVWATEHQKRPTHLDAQGAGPPVSGLVTDTGDCRIETWVGNSVEIPAGKAAALARWMLATFGETP